MKRQINKILLGILFIVMLASCKMNSKQTEIEQIIQTWVGKKIIFPDEFQCNSLGRDTIRDLCADLLSAEYKILLYVDSTGCSNCRINMQNWKHLIEESDSLFKDKLKFLFFFQPKNMRDIRIIQKGAGFDYPVFIDLANRIQALNHFPDKPEYQCFFLNAENEIIMVGNPTTNPYIWELYKTHISGEKQTQQTLTIVSPDKTTYNFGTIKQGNKDLVVFSITNTGNNPLIINHVSTSCGCTSVDWDKQPIEPGQSAKIKAVITPDETGYFNKSLEVFGNFDEPPLKLTIMGKVEN
ncbi:MAG: DUF1573 domain-containing protein [Dysgonamonadaceae bacterium]|jgi:hypothetical protein|nr:DUF1573 domain-containing protein [Dysgonamonadaceae bacterium]